MCELCVDIEDLNNDNNQVSTHTDTDTQTSTAEQRDRTREKVVGITSYAHAKQARELYRAETQRSHGDQQNTIQLLIALIEPE